LKTELTPILQAVTFESIESFTDMLRLRDEYRVIIQVDDVQPLMYGKRQALPNIIVSLRVDVSADMGLVTDIQQELRKAYCLRINYSANIKI